MRSNLKHGWCEGALGEWLGGEESGKATTALGFIIYVAGNIAYTLDFRLNRLALHCHMLLHIQNY